jgi:hypothetical protein
MHRNIQYNTGGPTDQHRELLPLNNGVQLWPCLQFKFAAIESPYEVDLNYTYRCSAGRRQPNTTLVPLTSYNTPVTHKGRDAKAKNELPENSRATHGIGHFYGLLRPHRVLPGPGTELIQVNEPWVALHNQGRSLRWQRDAGAGVRSLKCLCLRAETTVLGCKTTSSCLVLS